jgi:archaellum component FlaC
MTDNIADHTAIVLREIQAALAAIQNQAKTISIESNARLDRIEFRMGAVEQHLGLIVASSAGDRDEVKQLAQRVERIERRLELAP